MSWQDSVNGMLELLGAVAVFGHCLRAFRDKCIRGASLWATAFFSLWGFWNLFYYPSLGQWASFTGGLALVLANCFWLALMVLYRKN